MSSVLYSYGSLTLQFGNVISTRTYNLEYLTFLLTHLSFYICNYNCHKESLTTPLWSSNFLLEFNLFIYDLNLFHSFSISVNSKPQVIEKDLGVYSLQMFYNHYESHLGCSELLTYTP